MHRIIQFLIQQILTPDKSPSGTFQSKQASFWTVAVVVSHAVKTLLYETMIICKLLFHHGGGESMFLSTINIICYTMWQWM